MKKYEIKNEKNNSGFTLIELIVTVAITGLVFVLVLSFFSPRISLYNRASSEARINSELNLINTKIHSKLINASEIELLDSKPTTFTSGYKYYYINNNNQVVFVDGSGSQNILNNKLKFDTFNVSLYKRPDEQNYIEIQTEAVYDEADHNMDFDILLNNVYEMDQKLDSVALKFK
jgi:prepilin-type N-terminal cleavage/methylation domain-containing protein